MISSHPGCAQVRMLSSSGGSQVAQASHMLRPHVPHSSPSQQSSQKTSPHTSHSVLQPSHAKQSHDTQELMQSQQTAFSHRSQQ